MTVQSFHSFCSAFQGMHMWTSSSIHAQFSPLRFREICVLWERDAHLAGTSSSTRSTPCRTCTGALHVASDATLRSSSLETAAVPATATHPGEVQRTRVRFRTAGRDTGRKASVIHIPDPDPASKLRGLPLLCRPMPWSAWAGGSQSRVKDVPTFLSPRFSTRTNSTPSDALLNSPTPGHHNRQTPLA